MEGFLTLKVQYAFDPIVPVIGLVAMLKRVQLLISEGFYLQLLAFRIEITSLCHIRIEVPDLNISFC